MPCYCVGDNDYIIADFNKDNFGIKGNYKPGYYWATSNGNWYYKDVLAGTGGFHTGWLQYTPNEWYYLNSNGTMYKGWINVENYWYYLRQYINEGSAGAEGRMITGWFEDANKRWYFLTDWIQVTDTPYGSMRTGWLNAYGGWYYLRPANEGSWPQGSMVTGKYVINGKEYIFADNGVCTNP